MSEREICPYCSNPVSEESIRLWDGRAYCRKCIDEVSPDLFEYAAQGFQLSETVDRRDVRAIRYFLRVGKWHLLAVAIVFGLPFGLLVQAGLADVAALGYVLAFFGGGGLILIALKSIVAIFAVRQSLPRTVSVADGEIRLATRGEERAFNLSDCRWRIGGTTADQLCWFSGLNRGLIIYTPSGFVACGHDREILDHWRAFLTLAQVERTSPSGCLRIVALAGLGAVFGLVIGLGIGHLLSIFIPNNVWSFSLGLLGVVEGAMVAIIYGTCTLEGADTARKRLHPILVGLTFFAIGMKCGFVGGWTGAIACGISNGLFGALVAWFCRVKIRAAEAERELSAVFRR